jgi:CheY-like chemotaxis protein
MKVRILVVEDDDAMRRIICRVLSSRYDVTMARDGLEAIAKNTEKFDLVLMDVMMPTMSGELAFAAMDTGIQNGDLASGQAPPTLVISALSADSNKVRKLLEEDSVVGYVQKPFSGKELLEVVDKIVAGGGEPPDGKKFVVSSFRDSKR